MSSAQVGDLVLVVKNQNGFLPEPLVGLVVDVRDTGRYIYAYEILVEGQKGYFSPQEIRSIEDHK